MQAVDAKEYVLNWTNFLQKSACYARLQVAVHGWTFNMLLRSSKAHARHYFDHLLIYHDGTLLSKVWTPSIRPQYIKINW